METKVLAIFDKKTATYAQPFTVRHIGEAVREWDIVRKDETNKYGKNPEDFDLFQIGTYEDEFGTLKNTVPPLHISSGV